MKKEKKEKEGMKKKENGRERWLEIEKRGGLCGIALLLFYFHLLPTPNLCQHTLQYLGL